MSLVNHFRKHKNKYILLLCIRTIAQIYDISPATVQLCIKKYNEGGTGSALFDDSRKGRPVEITDVPVNYYLVY